MAIKGNISNTPNGVIGNIKTDINVYHGVETDSAKVTIDNRRKEIKVDVKEEFLDNKQDKLTAGKNITIDENNVISAENTEGTHVTPNPEVVGDEPLLNSVEIDGDKFRINNEGNVYHEGEGILIDEQNNISVDKDKIQEKLVSTENIKTINGYDILGEGNIEIKEGEDYTSGKGINISDEKEISVDTNTIQEKLVSGENIKTINGETLLGQGDISVGGAGGQPLVYTTVSSNTPQTKELKNATVTIYTSRELQSLTINFEENYKNTLGWVSEIIFRNNNEPTLIINNDEIKYIQFGANTTIDGVKSHISKNASIDMIFYYDGINTICYVSEIVD